MLYRHQPFAFAGASFIGASALVSLTENEARQAVVALAAWLADPLTVSDALKDPRVRAGKLWIARDGHPLIRIERGVIEYDTNDRWNDGADRWHPAHITLETIDAVCKLIERMTDDAFEALPRDIPAT